MTLLLWCYSFNQSIPPFCASCRYEHHGPEGRCGVAWDSSPSYTSIWVLSVFVVPIVIMLICYYFILQVGEREQGGIVAREEGKLGQVGAGLL